MTVPQVLHKLASPLLYKSGVYSRGWKARAADRPFTAVLVYHRVLEDGASTQGKFAIERGIPASVFEEQLRFMLKHFKPIKASEVLEPSSDSLRFAVTLDDGYEDNFRVAAPILKRLGISATFYVVSDFVGTGRQFWWEQLAEIVHLTKVPEINLEEMVPELVKSGIPTTMQLQSYEERESFYECVSTVMRAGAHTELPKRILSFSEILEVRPREAGRDYAMMDWGQLKKLVEQGFEIGGHTASHCNLEKVNDSVLQREIISSNKIIEQKTDSPVLTFAYPYGHYENLDAGVCKAISESGCRVAFTAVKGVAEEGANIFELPRTQLNRRYDFACAYNIQDSLN